MASLSGKLKYTLEYLNQGDHIEVTESDGKLSYTLVSAITGYRHQGLVTRSDFKFMVKLAYIKLSREENGAAIYTITGNGRVALK